MADSALVPFRWPAGWRDPKLISLLEGGPFNCIVASGAPNSVVEAARKAGITVLEWGSLGAAPLAKANWNAAAPRVTLTDLVWPRVKAAASRDEADSGPTGAPWIDSNSWVARLALARAPGKQIWLAFEPPKEEPSPSGDAYKVAVADAAAAGARWLVTLDEKLSQALAAGNAEALKTWRGIGSAVECFEKRSAWRGYTQQGPLAIISTFAGDNEFMGAEVLNLAARRNLLYRIVDRTQLASADLAGLRAAMWVDNDPPAGDAAAKLAAFARGGSLLIVPRTAASVFKGEQVLTCPVAGYELRTFGKGTVAAATRDWDDPYFLAAEVHSLVGRRHDPFRLFNGGSCWAHYSVAPAGQDRLIQLVAFGGGGRRGGSGAADISLRIPGPFRSVTVHKIDAAPEALQPAMEGEHPEYRLPQLSVYAALEVKA
ncbi:MAG: hypothetical protein ACE141_10640 [Bryobacteraceae bacterium]